MPERNGRAVIERYIELMNRAEFSRFAEVLHPDTIEEYPQSGERIRGISNIQAMREHYPGGLERQSISQHEVIGGEDRWVVAPNFTTIRITGESDRFTYVLRTTYPDGSDWYVLALIDLRDGLIVRVTTYFAPVFAAPEWRAPYREAPQG